MPELKRYRILVIVDEEVVKMGKYYGRSKTLVAKKAFKYLSRKLQCDEITFEMQEIASGKIYSFLGKRTEKNPPIVKKVCNGKYIIMRYNFAISEIKFPPV